MELKSETLHNLIDAEIKNIDFLLNLVNANKTLSLSLINTFVSTINLNNTSSDIEFYNKMLLELQLSLADNIALQKDLAEIKAQFEKITSRLDKNTLVNALDSFREKQSEVYDIELKLHSYTPKLLNKINHNIINHKSKELRDEIEKVLPHSAEEAISREAVSPVQSEQSELNIKPIEPTTDTSTEEVVQEEIKETFSSDANNEDGTIDVENNNSESTETSEEIENNSVSVSAETPVNGAIVEDIHENIENVTENTPEVKDIDSTGDKDDTREITNVVNTQQVNEEVQKAEGTNTNDDYASKDSLIISEITGEVTLPFSHTVVDINEFKNPISSRFREGYKLSRERENENVLISISIGLKLCFKSEIHPAIIRACRDFDDLDTYLFYLDNNQAEYYPNFKILYKTYPVKNYLN